MGCHFIRGAVICCPNIYEFWYNGENFLFEWHDYCGPCPVDKETLDPLDLPGQHSMFWAMVSEFQKLSRKKRKKLLVFS